MKRFLSTAALLCACSRVLYPLDGDTFVEGTEHIRIMGMDAPELHARCKEELALALKAKAALQALLQGRLSIERHGQDRYGRTLAIVLSDGRNIASVLIENGLARPYFGGKRETWCKENDND